MRIRKTQANHHARGPFIVLACFVFITVPFSVRAVPPPDFIFNVGSQAAQMFALATVFLSAIASAAYRYVAVSFRTFRQRAVLIGIAAAVILGLAGVGAFFFGKLEQWSQMRAWIAQSDRLLQDHAYDPERVSDQLLVEAAPAETINVTGEPVPPASSTEAGLPSDPGERLIRSYYRNIAAHRFEDAYAASKQTVPIETFTAWYEETERIIIDKLIRIDDLHYSLELSLVERAETVKYAVLMTLARDHNGLLERIEQSTVTVLGSAATQAFSQGIGEGQEKTFRSPLSATNIEITNDAFQELVASGGGAYVLDAREDLEFEYGRYAGSEHIRAADLYAGRWIELPVDRPVIVICWSGIRGQQVAEFLRQKGIDARYLENGADGWVSSGGAWDGDIKFSQHFGDARYTQTFSTNKTKDEVSDGAVLVDTREPARYEAGHIPGSVNIPLMYTLTSELNTVLAQVPARSTVITVCDDYVNCFDAKLTGVLLEQRGHVFLGRYVTPWEWK